ncbi:hypothetical protein MAR_020511, partial [Mya arenaria]
NIYNVTLLNYFTVRSQTLSGNGTSGGFTVNENASLELTCSTSFDDNNVVFAVRHLRFPMVITTVGYGLSGCVTEPIPPPYLSCSCVSRREYVCVIGAVTRARNGEVWFCVVPEGNLNDDFWDKTIVVTVGIISVYMVSPAGNTVSVIENTARQFRCETSAANPQAIVEWYKDNGTPYMTDDTEITTGKETDTSASGTLIVTIGKLTLTVQRNDHGVGVWCRATNGGAWLYSSSVALDVQFGPKKSDDGMYTCTATNQMTPTGSPGQTGNHSGTMHLNVQ